MTAHLKSVAVAWCDEAERMLLSAVQTCSILDIKGQVENGAQLFKLTQGNVLIGYYVLRVDHLSGHDEGVIVAAAGVHKDIDLTATAVPVIETQFLNCKFLRIHTARAGLVKKLAAIGYEPQEFVMRKQINA